MSIKLQQHNNFLTNQECDQLIEISRGKLVASTAGIDGESKIDESRISETYSLCDCSSLEKKIKTQTTFEQRSIHTLSLGKAHMCDQFVFEI